MNTPMRAFGIVALIMLCLTSCGQVDGNEPRRAQISAETRAVESLGQSLTDTIRGTLEQRAAAEYLITFALNEPTKRCMSASGYDWWPAELNVEAATPIEPFGESVWLREPMRPIASETVLLTAGSNRVTQASESREQSPDEAAVLIRCLEEVETTVPSDDELGELTYGQRTARLWGEFNSIVRETDEALGSADEYAECMAGLGSEVKDVLGSGTEGFSALRIWLETIEAPDPHQVPGEEKVEESQWQNFLATEQRVLLDDAECRAETYATGIDLLAPKLEEFSELRAEDLAELDRVWDEQVNDALAKGFVPDPALQEATQ